MSGQPCPEEPLYIMLAHQDGWATQLYMVICDEGWRSSIVCERMYGWAAQWLINALARRPYAPETRPG